MKKFKVLLACCLALFMLILAVCLSSNDSTSEPTQGIAPDILYAQAVDPLRTAESLSYTIKSTQTISLGYQDLTYTSQQDLNIENPGMETMRSSMVETLDYGAISVKLSEYYENGNGYVEIGENAFTAPITAEVFTKRYAPVVCIDPTLYQEIQIISIEDGIGINFSKPTGAEQWALPIGTDFADAFGYAVLDESGALRESVYTITYTAGTATITKRTEIVISDPCQVVSPQEPDKYKPIDCFDAPRMLEQACGYLVQAENVKSNAETVIDCQTFLIHRTQKSSLTLRDSNDDLSALLDIQIDQINQSRGGEVTQFRQTEAFENGKYTISLNGAPATGNKAIDAVAMKEYCQDVLIGDILLPSHIVGAAAEETDTAIILTFQPSDTLAEAICSNICTTLYSDGEVLHALSSDYNTQSVQYVLILDKYTGLLQSFSSQYSASHTIESIVYQLESKTEQTYQYTETSGQ